MNRNQNKIQFIFNRDELLILNNSLNEVVNGLPQSSLYSGIKNSLPECKNLLDVIGDLFSDNQQIFKISFTINELKLITQVLKNVIEELEHESEISARIGVKVVEMESLMKKLMSHIIDIHIN